MKKLVLALLLLFFAVAAVACTQGHGTPVSTDFAFDLPEKFDVDEEFPLSGKKGVVYYADGRRSEYNLTKENIVGFDTSTTGEKRAKLVYKGLEKAFSYVVEYASSPTKQIVTTARIRLNEAASLNGTAVALSAETGDLTGINAVSFTIDCSYRLDNKLEIAVLLDGWDVRVREYTSSAKVVAFRRGGSAMNENTEFLSIGYVGKKDVVFSVKDIVVTDGTGDYQLPNVK